jgi:hypothetical protein
LMNKEALQVVYLKHLKHNEVPLLPYSTDYLNTNGIELHILMIVHQDYSVENRQLCAHLKPYK